MIVMILIRIIAFTICSINLLCVRKKLQKHSITDNEASGIGKRKVGPGNCQSDKNDKQLLAYYAFGRTLKEISEG